MTPELFVRLALQPALTLLPPALTSTAAEALVLAICLQESGLVYRRQTPQGPARGFAQFEAGGGCAGVLTHPATAPLALDVCTRLSILPAATAVHRALEFHDVLAAAFARLLLWTLPDPLPDRDQVGVAWNQYLDAWRPGTPRPSTWREHYVRAWSVVTPATLPDNGRTNTP